MDRAGSALFSPADGPMLSLLRTLKQEAALRNGRSSGVEAESRWLGERQDETASLDSWMKGKSARHALPGGSTIYLPCPMAAPSVLEVELETFRATMETNCYGPLLLCQAWVPGMIRRGYGRVVNVSSGAGQLSTMGDYAPAYSASKAALNALTRMVSDAARGANVLVNAVDPGWVRTRMGGRAASRSVEQGIDTIVWLATLPDGGPTGGFFYDRQPIPW